MNKRQFLYPLAVSVAALLGGARVPTQASTDPAHVPAATAPDVSAPWRRITSFWHALLGVLGVKLSWLITSRMLRMSRTLRTHPMRSGS